MNDDGFEYASYVCEYSNDTSYNVLHFSNIWQIVMSMLLSILSVFVLQYLSLWIWFFAAWLTSFSMKLMIIWDELYRIFACLNIFLFFFWTFALLYDLLYQKSTDWNSTYRLSTIQDLAQWISSHSKRKHPYSKTKSILLA